MKSYAQLFLLIQTLNPSEKRYLKLESEAGERGGSTQYMDLFRLLDSQDVYDPEELRKQFKGEQFLKHLPVAKAYLTDVLLRVLRAYHGKRLPSMHVSRGLDEIEVLLEKGQVEMARRWVKKNAKLAGKLADFSALLKLCQYERRIAKLSPGKNLLESLSNLEKKEIKLLNQYQVQLRIRQIHDQFYAIRTQNAGKVKPSELNVFLPLLADSALQFSENQLDPESRINKANIFAIYHQLLGQNQSVLNWYENIVNQWEQFPEKQKQEPYLYLKSLMDYLDYCIELGARQKFREAIGKVRIVKVRNPKERARRFILNYHLQLRFHLNQKDFVAAVGLGPGIERGLQKNRGQITASVYLTFSYNLLVLHFILENYSDAIQWTVAIGNVAEKETRKDIRSMSRLFHIIALFETKDWVRLEMETRRITIQLPKRESRIAEILLEGLFFETGEHLPARYGKLMGHLENEGLLDGLGGKEIKAWLRSRSECGKTRTYI